MSIEDFDADWRIVWPKGIIECHSPRSEITYTVTDFWRWVRKEEASETGMPFPTVLETDGMGPSYGLPRKVKLTKAYTIDSQSIKHLTGTDTTLLDSNNNVLVADSIRKERWWENSLVQGVLILLAIVGVILALV